MAAPEVPGDAPDPVAPARHPAGPDGPARAGPSSFCRWPGAELRRTQIFESELTPGVVLRGARLTRSIVFETDPTGIDLRRARADDAVIVRSNMPGAKVAGATFAGSDCFGFARLDGTTTSGTDLIVPCTGLPGAPAS